MRDMSYTAEAELKIQINVHNSAWATIMSKALVKNLKKRSFKKTSI